jgi:uncharacterized protein
MVKYRTYKFFRKDQVMIFIPGLEQIRLVSTEEAESMSDYVEGGVDDQIISEKPHFPPKIDKLTLFMSDACNMRCAYCYAEGGSVNDVLSEEKIGVALNYLFNNSLSDEVIVRFLGGEPTVSWRELRGAVALAKDIASNRQMGVNFTMESNGVWSDEQLQFISNNFFHVGISIDGPPDIQNKHRPLPDGAPSFQKVDRTVKRLLSLGSVDIKLCPVVTAYSVNRISEIAEFLCREYPGTQIFFTPMDAVGYGVDGSSLAPPSIDRYLSGFMEAADVVKSMNTGNDVVTSIMDFSDLKSTIFCGGNGRNFIILPTGYVSACNKVVKSYKDGRDVFLYGAIEDGAIRFFEGRFKELASYDAVNIDRCKSCYALNACRGGCPVLKCNGDRINWNKPDANCEAIKNAVERYLWWMVDNLEPEVDVEM